jgi:hypothetical protein
MALRRSAWTKSSPTGRPEALARGSTCGFSLPSAAYPDRAALRVAPAAREERVQRGAQEVVAGEAHWGACGQGGGAKRAFILPIRAQDGRSLRTSTTRFRVALASLNA